MTFTLNIHSVVKITTVDTVFSDFVARDTTYTDKNGQEITIMSFHHTTEPLKEITLPPKDGEN